MTAIDGPMAPKFESRAKGMASGRPGLGSPPPLTARLGRASFLLLSDTSEKVTRSHLPVERAFRDVRTFSLHFRESQLLRMLAQADLGGEFHSKEKYGPRIGRQSWQALGADVPDFLKTAD